MLNKINDSQEQSIILLEMLGKTQKIKSPLNDLRYRLNKFTKYKNIMDLILKCFCFQKIPLIEGR